MLFVFPRSILGELAPRLALLEACASSANGLPFGCFNLNDVTLNERANGSSRLTDHCGGGRDRSSFGDFASRGDLFGDTGDFGGDSPSLRVIDGGGGGDGDMCGSRGAGGSAAAGGGGKGGGSSTAAAAGGGGKVGGGGSSKAAAGGGNGGGS